MPLEEEEQMRLGGAALTTPERTAEDIFLGIGTVGTRKPADRLITVNGWLREDLCFWPQRPGKDEHVYTPGDDEQNTLSRLLDLIGQLLQGVDDLEAMAERIVERTKRSANGEKGRAARIAELLDQCISRRFPTVR
ncbi:hypothetical protein [Nesterenkonia pannonica]|uniref:hypothetical protein n=1 Tax=Nesterenkonia pannonica TaxID=1548602 RepID=UPI00216497EE|nr:hypothetical protein [Nesterenkonia pannonica]